ncbi:hypothetical protein [Roseateles sp. MS654]|uniref:hypothetical protein n=1 Tax=Roseateles sp. MS654 TaxID=3412685 RepID=UPI003C30A84A
MTTLLMRVLAVREVIEDGVNGRLVGMFDAGHLPRAKSWLRNDGHEVELLAGPGLLGAARAQALNR